MLILSNNIVHVAPITHTPPQVADIAIEVPQKTKERLGLDDMRSWVICAEISSFQWPGPDLQIVPHKNGVAYGPLPPALYDKIKHTILHYAQRKQPPKLKIIGRTT